MKVMWVCNSKPSALLGTNNVSLSSWIDALYDEISPTADITVIYPCFDRINSNFIRVKGGFGVKQERIFSFFPLKKLVSRYVEILKEVNPEIIHIWGCETPRSYAFICAAKIVGLEERVVVSLQGSAQKVGKYYYGGLPLKAKLLLGIKACLKLELSFFAGLRFKLYGHYENKVYKSPVLFIGRTSWDHSLLLSKAPKANYVTLFEEVRKEFYERKWAGKDCIKGRIFIAQASYPLKGFDNALDALILLNKWLGRSIELYVAGDFDERNNVYSNYLNKKINKENLNSQVHFVGLLSAAEMAKQLEIANIYLNCSYVENESNALSEAMVVGTPVIASFVGGMVDRIKHDWSGLFFPADSATQLAWCIKKVIDNHDEAKLMADRLSLYAQNNFRPGNSSKELIDIYNNILCLNLIKN